MVAITRGKIKYINSIYYRRQSIALVWPSLCSFRPKWVSEIINFGSPNYHHFLWIKVKTENVYRGNFSRQVNLFHSHIFYDLSMEKYNIRAKFGISKYRKNGNRDIKWVQFCFQLGMYKRCKKHANFLSPRIRSSVVRRTRNSLFAQGFDGHFKFLYRFPVYFVQGGNWRIKRNCFIILFFLLLFFHSPTKCKKFVA